MPKTDEAKRIAQASDVLNSVEQRVFELKQANIALETENQQLRDELDEAYAEPKWFSHRGDYMVIVALIMILSAGTYYVGAIRGWWQ